MVPLEYLLSFVYEDAPYGDVTTTSIIGNRVCRGALVARQDGTLAGIEEASLLFGHFGVECTPKAGDGMEVSSGTEIAILEGPAAGMLLVERTALNIIGRMSGIATQTRRMCNIVSSRGLKTRIASTRKTAPGLRSLDKKAVTLGGGEGHRLGLSDGILIKDNHLALVGLGEAIQKAKVRNLYRKIEVEVENAEDALLAAGAGADILLLDNMEPDQIRETVRILEREKFRDSVVLEVSGGINEQNLFSYAIQGIDIISVGSLTHSVSNFDISLEIFP